MTFMNFYCSSERRKTSNQFYYAFAAVFSFWRAHDENWQWQKTRKNLNARLGVKTGFIALFLLQFCHKLDVVDRKCYVTWQFLCYSWAYKITQQAITWENGYQEFEKVEVDENGAKITQIHYLILLSLPSIKIANTHTHMQKSWIVWGKQRELDQMSRNGWDGACAICFFSMR